MWARLEAEAARGEEVPALQFQLVRPGESEGGEVIYMASPYSSPDVLVREERYRLSCVASACLIRRGNVVYSPIAASHGPSIAGKLPGGWDFWKSQDSWFIEHCDELYVIMLPGWHKSVGVRAEIGLARSLGKPVKYWRLVGEEFEQVEVEEE